MYNVASAAIIIPNVNELPLQLCLSSIIKNNFKENVPIYYVNGRTTSFLPYNSTNQYVFVDSNDHVHSSEFMLYNQRKNLILFGASPSSLYNCMTKLWGEELVTKYTTEVTYLIVTPHPYPEEIFLILWGLDIVNVLVLRTNSDTRRLLKLYTSNPFNKKNQCGFSCNVYETHQCGSAMRLKKFGRVRNFNGCPVVIKTKPEKGVPSIHRRVSDFALRQMKAYLNITYYFGQKKSPDKDILIEEYLQPKYTASLGKCILFFEDDTVWVSDFQKRIPDTKILRSVFSTGVWLVIGGSFFGLSFFPSYFYRTSWLYTVFITLIFQSNLIKILTVEHQELTLNIADITDSRMPICTNDQCLIDFASNPLEKVAREHDCHTFGARHLVAKFEIDNNLMLNTFVDNSVIGKLNMSYNVIEGCAFIDVLNEFMEKFVETGVHSKVISDTKGMYYMKVGNDEEHFALTLGHFGEAFFCWGVGLIISGVIFVVELIKH
ncbi:hypothetical protein FQR65_LT06940 [Abscondita terminalis]|nr:hypothetical protein FQR65_LT06940 [Abscondita terminalis]